MILITEVEQTLGWMIISEGECKNSFYVELGSQSVFLSSQSAVVLLKIQISGLHSLDPLIMQVLKGPLWILFGDHLV